MTEAKGVAILGFWRVTFVGGANSINKRGMAVALAPTPGSNEVSLREASGNSVATLEGILTPKLLDVVTLDVAQLIGVIPIR